MGSGSSAKYATKKENVEPAASPGSREQPTPVEKPTASTARTAHHEEKSADKGPPNNFPEIRVTAATKRSPRAPAQHDTREPPHGLHRPGSGRPGSKGRVGSKRKSLGQALDHLEQTRSPRSPGEPGEASYASEVSGTGIANAGANPAAKEARRRASWYVEPPPPPGPSACEVMDELSEKYPSREFELTAFACLPGLRPGMGVTLGACDEQPSLNDLAGLCKDYDCGYHVWVLQFDDERWMRVIPLEMRSAMLTDDGDTKKCVKCCIAYGEDVGDLLIDREQKTRREYFDGPSPKPRKPKPVAVAVAEPTPEPEEPARPVVVPRPEKPKPVVQPIEVPEAEDVKHGYQAGDLVTFLEARGLGIGKVIGVGKSEGEVLVQFGKGSHIYSLESAHLEKVKKKEMKRRKSVS